MNLQLLEKNVRKYRKSRKPSQEKLAEMTCFSPKYISVIERGVQIPSLAAFCSLVEALEVSADALLSGVFENQEESEYLTLSRNIQMLPPEKRTKAYMAVDSFINLILSIL